MKHSFVICAYKESPYLEECIRSVMNQSVSSEVLLATSTPNEHIQKLADQYSIPVYVNHGSSGITQDWNFAYAQAKTQYVTLAHQDDIYLENYTEQIMKRISKDPRALIAFTDYGELRNGIRTDSNTLLNIKRILLTPMKSSRLSHTVLCKRAVLAFGDPICCPAVTFNRRKLPPSVFTAGFRSNEDWEAWERISRLKGSFCYIPEIGMYHRIHEGSATTEIIQDSGRMSEDITMFRKFWPYPAAWLLARVYSLSEKSNSTD